jgi:hypothetical protein
MTSRLPLFATLFVLAGVLIYFVISPFNSDSPGIEKSVNKITKVHELKSDKAPYTKLSSKNSARLFSKEPRILKKEKPKNLLIKDDGGKSGSS